MSKESDSGVVFENDQWSYLQSFFKEHAHSQSFVLVDENTQQHCLPLFQTQLERFGIDAKILKVPAGETSKDIEFCVQLWQELTHYQADRKSLLINLGGGMITDLGGFVAATYKRGIDFLNIPTSLLAMVDASAGGKCGIDFLHYKNQIGVFQEALKTIIIPEFLETLPLKELKSGYAEVIKHALIADKQYFMRLQSSGVVHSKIDSSILASSVKIKQQIVQQDPYEKGERKKLNFGHTVGHAIESYFFEKEKTIPHGFAVAAGMICESYLSQRIIGLSEEEHLQIVELVQKNFELPKIEENDINPIMEYIAQDKKNKGKQTQFTLLEQIGLASINHHIELEQIKGSLTYYCELL